MKLLLFSDLHRDRAAARSLLRKADDADVLIGAGDFATTRRGLRDVIEVLRVVSRPSILVAGNSESPDELIQATADWETATVLHGQGCVVNDVPFWGLGGAVPVTPFGARSYDLTESQAAALLKGCPGHAVLVTHSPPKGMVDRSSAGVSLGSTAVREAIDVYAPRLVVCGHIHASAGEIAQAGSTTIVNAGPAGILWDLND